MAALSRETSDCRACILVAARADPGISCWRTARDRAAPAGGLGFHVAVLDVAHLAPGERVDFTWRWQDSGMWQSRDYTVAVLPPGDAPASRSPDPGRHFPILNSRT
jgi:hypothetical protein